WAPSWWGWPGSGCAGGRRRRTSPCSIVPAAGGGRWPGGGKGAETLKEEVVEAAALDSLRGRGEGSSRLSSPVPRRFLSVHRLHRHLLPRPPPAAGNPGRGPTAEKGGAGRAGRSGPAGGGGLWQLQLRELAGPFRARGSAPPPRFVPPAPRAQRGGHSSPCTQAAPTGTPPRLASCSDLLGQARRRAFPLWKCFPGGTGCGACMEKKMGEAVARVARKVNETVENGAESLDLADCKLMMFPIGIYKVMRNVTEGIHLITLANNELKSVTSKFITTFSQMRELNLEGNYLHRLPEEMRTLLHLKVINLSRNKFRHFPEQLTTLKGLETINLEENEITDVPVEKLSSMESLQCVNLKSNPLNEEVQVIARPLIKFDLLVSPKGAHAAPQA
uniref:Leucine rich repeat containing 20 n=2 Tax=Terrapene triunguis TaxID=2587831 RepID=A0A674I0F5_9SAUR